MILPYNFTADEVISVGRTSRTNVEAVKSSLKICNESYVPKELPDELIVEFLLACENDVEFAKTTISVHYRLKKEEPLLFDNYSGINPEIKELFDIWSISTLPTRTKENYSIHYFRLESSDLKKFNSITVLRSALMVVDITLNNNPPDGFIVIVDLNLAGLRHLTKLKYDLIKKFFCFIQEALPMRLKAIHVLNNNFIVTQFFNLIKTFVKNEVFERVSIR
uniref:Alpha-tocopherol transfer protein-like isoform X3 n=1 Tax=Diabrotica virgifera virgifera TaxID=50390 RepID=A0A6P7GAQ4_DIAVI